MKKNLLALLVVLTCSLVSCGSKVEETDFCYFGAKYVRVDKPNDWYVFNSDSVVEHINNTTYYHNFIDYNAYGCIQSNDTCIWYPSIIGKNAFGDIVWQGGVFDLYNKKVYYDNLKLEIKYLMEE